ncbi:MAG: HAD family acid phosphatase [Acidimicrobiales bacterium]|nr:HAD family acid phosphatase [Acidimicrobiales bacterium]
MDGPTKDWWAFFEASVDDPPIPEAIRLVERLTEDHTVILLTARPSGSADTTLEWLGRHGVNWDLLAMRNQNDHGSSPEVKRAILTDLRSDGYEPVLAIDDDPGNLVMYRSEGLLTVYVHSGYYDA